MINFPSNPTTGDVYSFQGRIWRWNGVSWRTIASSYSGNVIIIGGSSGNVVSVNGQTGIVTLSTANVAEYGNLYFTNSRAIGALTAGAGISIASNGRITSTATGGGGGGVGDVISVNGANGLVNLFVSSPTTPTNPTLGTIWFKSGEGNLFLYINDGNSNIWIEVDTGAADASVASVNGLVGDVILTTSNITEGANLYFSNTRAVSALTAGTGVDIAANGLISSTALGGVTGINNSNGNVQMYFTSPTVPNANTLGSLWFNPVDGNLSVYISDNTNNFWIEIDQSGASVLSVNGQTGSVVLTTANVSEQSNLYFTNSRVYANVIELGYAKTNDLTTANISELTNLYYTNSRVYSNVIELGYSTNSYVNTRLSSKANVTDLTTSNVSELTNLYFTNTRSISALTAGTGVEIAANGLITSTAIGGVSSVNGANGNVNLFYASNTAPTQIPLGSLWYKQDQSNIYVYVNDGTSNIWIEIDQGGVAADVNTVNGLTGDVVLTTANIAEQSNLYFTNSRVYANVLELGYATNAYVNSRLLTKANVADLTTSNVVELTNLYFTNSRVYSNVIELGYATNSYVNTRLDTKANVADLTTANVAELTNLYFTNARVLSYLQQVGGNLLPASDIQYSLGSPSRRWKDLYISGNTVYLGNALIEASNTSVTLPPGSEIIGQTTSNLIEGTNLYYTNARVSANVATLGYAPNAYVNTRLLTKANVSDLTTANVSELTNLYYTNARVYDNVITLGYSTNAYVNTRLLTKANVSDLTTANVAELTNLYFTNTRAISALTGGAGIIIAANGRITANVSGGSASVTASNTAPTSPTEGALWLETDNGDVYIYYSNSWVAINVPNYIEPVLSIDQFSGNDSTLTYNLSATPANLYYTTVFVDGVYQSKLTYSITGNSIVFTEAPPTGSNNIEVTTYSIKYLPVTKEYKYNKYTANGVGKVYGLQSFGHTNTSILVFENGICQMPEDDYYVSSNAVIFATAPAANVVIQIRELPLT